jgi:hypothetical protein
VHDNLATIIGGGIDTLWLQDLPAPIQVPLAVRVLATSDELAGGQEHPFVNLDCADVAALGLAPVSVSGADRYRLDGDGDGIGCE